ncbi:MAG: HAD family hydrolase [Actinobacteria bacterium]|nr:HAD family hydrolase [Actinomycetota bacterium]
MTARYRMTVFDLDGTLIDSRAHILANSRAAFTACGLPPPDPAALLSRVGLPLADCLVAGYAAVSGHAPAPELLGRLRAEYLAASRADGWEGIALFPGLRELLAQLAGSGTRLAIATSKGREGTAAILGRLGLAGMFEVVVCHDDGLPTKPDPAMLWHIAQRCGVIPRDLVMVGDTSYDLAMGRAAGTDTCGVVWGHHDRATLTAESPTYLALDPAELARALTRPER